MRQFQVFVVPPKSNPDELIILPDAFISKLEEEYIRCAKQRLETIPPTDKERYVEYLASEAALVARMELIVELAGFHGTQMKLEAESKKLQASDAGNSMVYDDAKKAALKP